MVERLLAKYLLFLLIDHQQQLSILLCPEKSSSTVSMMILAASCQLPSLQVFLGLPFFSFPVDSKRTLSG